MAGGWAHQPPLPTSMYRTLRLVFPCRTNSKSFHYFLLKFLWKPFSLSCLQKYTIRELKKQENIIFFQNHLIYRGHSMKLQCLMHLLLNYSCTKCLNKENNKNRIFNFNLIIFFFPILLLQYLEAEFRKEKYFNVFLK